MNYAMLKMHSATSASTNKTICVTKDYLDQNRLEVKKLVRKYLQMLGLGNKYFSKTMWQLENGLAFIFGNNAGYMVVDLPQLWPHENTAIITQYYNMTQTDLDDVLKVLKQSGKDAVLFQAHQDMDMPGWKRGPRIYSKVL